MTLNQFKKEADHLLKTDYGINLGDITDEKEIELNYHLKLSPCEFIEYLANKYDLKTIR